MEISSFGARMWPGKKAIGSALTYAAVQKDERKIDTNMKDCVGRKKADCLEMRLSRGVGNMPQ